MKRTLALLFALLLLLAACGGDDDDDAGGSGGGGDDTETAAGGGDFCEVWPSLNSDQQELTGLPSEEDLDRARELLDQARDATPEEIEDEVSQFITVIEGLLDDLAAGNEPDEDMFGSLFALAFSAGPAIEAWLVENCPDYEPTGFGSESSGSAFEADDFSGGMLGVSGEDIAALLNEAFPGGHYGYGGGGDDTSYDWEITLDVTADEAVAACESFAQALAEHPDLAGTLTFRIRQYVEAVDDPDTDEIEFEYVEGDVLAENAGISSGDPGTCEAPSGRGNDG